MSNEFNEGEGIGTQHETEPHVKTGFPEPETHHEEGENDESSAGTWLRDAEEWLTTTIRDRPLGALLVVAGASLVTGVVTGLLIRSPQE
jgi:hypothetical protein